MNDGGWAVIDSEGRFFDSPDENAEGLFWKIGANSIPFRQIQETLLRSPLAPEVSGR